MKITPILNNKISFKGYDAIPLKGIYMQGLTTPAEKRIFQEMKEISKEEKWDLFFNENNTKISKEHKNLECDKNLSIWGQDRKSFVKNKNEPTILWSSTEKVLNEKQIKTLGKYKINAKRYIPRGGNYYIGYKENGDKWLLINNISIATIESFYDYGDLPTQRHLYDLFDIKPENLFTVNVFERDLDETVRPIGYPNILINDYEKSLENIERMKEKFPESEELYIKIKKHLESLNDSIFQETKQKNIEKLKKAGFNPIKIGGYYCPEINFMNAIAYTNKNNKISYITNSTKHTTAYLEYLEDLFKENLKNSVPDVEKIYFVSGGPKEVLHNRKTNKDESLDLFSNNNLGIIDNQNTIMSILANRLGGIHCMSAEIPDFRKMSSNKKPGR